MKNRPLGALVAFLLMGFSSCRAEDKVPRVLVIVDSIHQRAAGAAAQALKGKAEVVIPGVDPGHTGGAIEKLGALTGEEKWDVIHFNYGFADLRHVDPKTKSARAMSRHAGGERVTSPEAYAKNLRRIVGRLKETGAMLIWASTTPLLGTKGDSLYEPESEVVYNAIAARIMKEEGIPINDMHAWVLTEVPKHTDPFNYGRVAVHEPIVRAISKALNLP